MTPKPLFVRTLNAAWLALAALGLSATATASDQSWENEIALELRAFPQTALDSAQGDASASISWLSEYYREWQRGDFSISLSPFARLDSMDSERSHVDLREAYWQGVYEELEIRAGISKVFWGKTELLHLVDVINQDDGLENLDGEDKLGQPMLRLSWAVDGGSLQAYVLPYFRERQFAGEDGRLRAPLPINEDQAIYASKEEENHLDVAFRFQGYRGSLDYGLSWFKGTHRDPQFLPAAFINTPQGPQPTELRPYYGQVQQISFDGQLTVESWLFKLEALWRDADQARVGPGGLSQISQRYAAATGGLEWTQYGVFDSAADLGWLVEYLWDERGRDSAASFQNDLFVGSRLALNDVKGSTLLAGLVMDLDQGSRFGTVEASRRLTGNSSLALELRIFNDIDPRDGSLFALRRDDYLQLEWRYFF